MPESCTSPTQPDPADTSAVPGRRKIWIGAGVALAAIGVSAAALLTAHDTAPGERHAAKAPASAASARSAAADPLISHTPSPHLSVLPDRTRDSKKQADKALRTWRAANPAAGSGVGGAAAPGTAGAIREVLRIPALGKNWSQPVYEGTDDRQLRAGVGHFPTTEQAGQVGNFALAGHRSGVTAPAFHNIDRIKTGTTVTVITARRITYTYTVTQVRTVAPSDVDVIAQVPDRPAATPTQAKLTLVTCWPADGHAKRVVVEADLVSARGGAQ
ncbi:sortase [Streptomyces sp. NPDC057654]|uniref:sortase n=1 Tax=Streptomyces sp. NPDC057654 TaxID=3346196 RepID=UPI003673D814